MSDQPTDPKSDTAMVTAADLQAVTQRCAKAVDAQLQASGLALHFTVLVFAPTQGSILVPDQQQTPVFYASSADRTQMLTAMRDFLRLHTH